jgi:hypothetical protein
MRVLAFSAPYSSEGDPSGTVKARFLRVAGASLELIRPLSIATACDECGAAETICKVSSPSLLPVKEISATYVVDYCTRLVKEPDLDSRFFCSWKDNRTGKKRSHARTR